MTRTFIAVDLNDEARSYLHEEIQRLARALPRVRWVDPETLHLTLAFLGELDDTRLALATKAALETAQTAHPFRLRIGSLGMFGPAHNPRVIWIGLAGSVQPLLDVQARLTDRLAQDGFPPEERAYAPHLTLARIKSPLSPQELTSLRHQMAPGASGGHGSSQPARPSNAAHPEIPVVHLSVMKSELTRDGAQYTRLEQCPFAE